MKPKLRPRPHDMVRFSLKRARVTYGRKFVFTSRLIRAKFMPIAETNSVQFSIETA